MSEAFDEIVVNVAPFDSLGAALLALSDEDRRRYLATLRGDDLTEALDAFAVAARRLLTPELYDGRCVSWRACRRCAAGVSGHASSGPMRDRVPELGWCVVAARQEVDHYDAWMAAQPEEFDGQADPARFPAGVCHVPWFSPLAALRCAPAACCYGSLCGTFTAGQLENAARLDSGFPALG